MVWLPKHSLLLLTFVEWKVQHIVLRLFGRGPYWKQACYFISLLKTWAQLSSLIAPNKLKGGHCYYGYCCDKLTSKTQTQLQPLFTTPSSPCATECLTGHKSLLLVAKHNHLCNVDGVAVEGASLQVRWKCLKLFLTMCYRAWAVIWRQLSSAVENVRGGSNNALLYLIPTYIQLVVVFTETLKGVLRCAVYCQFCYSKHRSVWAVSTVTFSASKTKSKQYI